MWKLCINAATLAPPPLPAAPRPQRARRIQRAGGVFQKPPRPSPARASRAAVVSRRRLSRRLPAVRGRAAHPALLGRKVRKRHVRTLTARRCQRQRHFRFSLTIFHPPSESNCLGQSTYSTLPATTCPTAPRTPRDAPTKSAYASSTPPPR